MIYGLGNNLAQTAVLLARLQVSPAARTVGGGGQPKVGTLLEDHDKVAAAKEEVPQRVALLNVRTHHDLRLVFCWGILQSIDRISRATGIRFYLPFVSKQVFDTAAAIPSRFKVTENTGKLVFRRTAMRTLPEEICSRRKIGFETPVSRWLQQKEFADQVRAAFRTSEGARFFRRKELDRIWKGYND